MPELLFKGKEFVFNHHLTVPHRPLVPDVGRSAGEPRLDGNLIVNGDNLHALKSLLPMYAGKIDCIFIDPPYNTGNEGWCYNDNVNSPMMQQWLSENPVGIEDGLRHDKWCAMMWPRLRLLHELLGETGSIWITLDDNEANRARMILDAIFGEENFVNCFIWRKVDSPNDNKVAITPDHDYMLCYAKNKELTQFSPMLSPGILDAYSSKAEDGRFYRDRLLKKNGKNSLRRDRPSMFFAIDGPDGLPVYPIHDNGEEACWAASTKTVETHITNGTLIWKQRERLGQMLWEPYTREFAPEVPTRPYPTIWSDLPTMRQAKAMLRDIFNTSDLFNTPKPLELIQRVIELVNQPNATILDSFAGSGTTAHAVLEANRKDGGNRKFILVECEEYADSLTAERVRRVINGYSFQGTQREELMRKSITFSDLKKADKLLHQIAGVENIESHRFDKIEKKIKDGELVVEGVKAVTERVEGLGGSFTYCTLGEAIDMDRMLTGESLPEFSQLGALLFHMATNEAIDPGTIAIGDDGHGYLGESSAFHVWLIYKPDLEFLKSRDSALTLSKAKAFAAAKPEGKRHLVFAPAKFVSQKVLDEEKVPVEFAPLPWALYRIERS
jgi:adenine-specific DNA-methyltransferase